MKRLFVVGITLALGIMTAENVSAAGDATKGKATYAVCAACHGANGMGNKALNAPRIAGQEPWYLERQLKNYKGGIRGADPKDTYGMQMRPMALTLANDQAISNMVAYLSSMPMSAPAASSVKGDVAAGTQRHLWHADAAHGFDLGQ